MAGVTGLEPAASGVTGRRSNQLSYTPNVTWTVRMRSCKGPPGACQDMNDIFMKSFKFYALLRRGHKENGGR